MLRRLLFAVSLALVASPALNAAWKYQANRYDLRTAKVDGSAATPDGPAKAQLVIQYSPDKKGTLSIQFIVAGASKMKGFPFEAFEGPDAPAASSKLTRFTAEKAGAKPLSLETTVGGWYLDDTFIFSSSDVNERPADVFKFVRSLTGETGKIGVTVRSPKDAKKTLTGEFGSEGLADALAKLLK